MLKRRRPREPRKLTIGMVYDFVAAILIILPCAVLLALENKIPGVQPLWAVVAVCTGMYVCALAVNRIRNKTFALGSFLYKNGGFVVLFGMTCYRALAF